jgi:LPXTG-motif cell wall-anchored protein
MLSAGVASLGPVLRINLDTAPSVPAGSNDVALANISVGATGANFNVTSIPLMISTSANGSVANLSDCKIRDASNLDGSLSSVATVTNGGATTFNFASPLFVSAGTANMLSLTCDVQPATAVGSAFVLSVTPGTVTASNASTGASVTPAGIPAGGTGPLGLPASTSGTVTVSAVGTAPVTPGTGTDMGSTPGVPNTGLGSSAGLLAVIAIAGIIALFGAFYLGRRREI